MSVRVGEATSYVDGATITAKSGDGWLYITAEVAESITGYAVTVNGRDLPYQPEVTLRAALEEIEALDRAGHRSELAADMGLIARRALSGT